MARKDRARQPRIDEQICAKIEALKQAEGYAGEFSGYVETLLNRIILGHLVDRVKFELDLRRQIMAEMARVKEAHISDFEVEPVIEHKRRKMG
jgi:hypothetical protein